MVGGTFASKWYLRYANGYPTWSDRYRFRTWSTLLKLESYYSVHCICTMCPEPEIQKRNGYYPKRSHFWTPFGKAKSCFRSKRFSELQQLQKLVVLDTHYEIVNWYSRERLKTNKIYFAYFSLPIDMAVPVTI